MCSCEGNEGDSKMSRIFKLMTVTAILIAVLMLGTSVASATTIVFNLTPYASNPGVITKNSELHGSGIGILEIVVNGGTPIDVSALNMVLAFDTGTLVGTGPFTFTGGNLGITAGSTSYMYGTFTNGIIAQFPAYNAIVAGFNDYKLEALADLLDLAGIEDINWFGNLTVSFYGTLAAPGAIVSGDVTNESAVPEPSLILLLGLGLAAVVLLQWKLSR